MYVKIHKNRESNNEGLGYPNKLKERPKMPELPEVETVVRGMQQKLEGATLKKVEVRREGLRYPFPPILSQLKNMQVTGVSRRAKFALLHLNSGQTVLFHLGMSGRILFPERHTPLTKHDHLSLYFEKNGIPIELRMNDPRRFGVVDVCPTNTLETNKHIATQGPEPLGDTFTANYLYQTLKKRSLPIKQAIMTNQVVVGVGNIYANEALFMAGIHPNRKTNAISKARIAQLQACIVKVLKAAISAGGTSLKDYVQTDGTLGYFQHNFKVYGRAGQPCPVCGVTIRKIVQGGRASYFCPTCQH